MTILYIRLDERSLGADGTRRDKRTYL